MNEIEKSKLHATFNKWVSSVDPQQVSNEMKIFLMTSFPDIMEEAFPKKGGIFSLVKKDSAEEAKQ